MSGRRWWLVFVAAAAVLVIITGVAAAYFTVASGSGEGAPVTVAIEEGISGSDIAVILERRGVISSALAFRIYLRLRGGAGSLKAGEYELRRNMPFGDLLAKLRSGPDLEFVKLTIPEGLNVEQIAALVSEKTHIGQGDFLEAVLSPEDWPDLLPEEPGADLLTGPLEGFLYPDTYFIDEKETAASLVERLIANFDAKTEEVDWGDAERLGVTPYEALIIASLIEEETKVEEERALISAVIHNRLELGMTLGIDATIQFAVKKYDGGGLTQEDLEVDSPYNTRRNPGLPPGPIANPRLASIEAALAPAPVDYLYFVLTADCRSHFFTVSFEEFSAAKSETPTDC